VCGVNSAFVIELKRLKHFAFAASLMQNLLPFVIFHRSSFLLYISNKKLVVLNLVDSGFLLLAFGYLKCTIVQKYAPLHCSFASGDS